MCFVDRSICSDCKTVTETHTPKKLCARTPDVRLRGCEGKVVVDVEHTTSEFCVNCYHQKLVEIRRVYGEQRVSRVRTAKKQGYTPSQIDSLKAEVEHEMNSEVGKLDHEWEKKWCA